MMTMAMSNGFGSALDTQASLSEEKCSIAGQSRVQQVRGRIQEDPDDVAQFLCATPGFVTRICFEGTI